MTRGASLVMECVSREVPVTLKRRLEQLAIGVASAGDNLMPSRRVIPCKRTGHKQHQIVECPAYAPTFRMSVLRSMRFIKPANTRPGPISTNVVTPAASSARIVFSQSTGCST
jgi:hypothetical protein